MLENSAKTMDCSIEYSNTVSGLPTCLLILSEQIEFQDLPRIRYIKQSWVNIYFVIDVITIIIFFITRHSKIINFIPHRITRNLITILSIAFFLHSKHQSVYRADGEGEGKSIFRITDIFQKECLENEFCCRSSGGYPGGQNIGFVPRLRMIRHDFLSKDKF